jgi:chaperonin GroEL
VVKTPVHGQRGAIDDLAVLTGGRPFLKEAGDSLRRFSSNDFGQARTAWVTRQQFGLIGGQGDPQAVRRHTETLRGSHRSAGDKDARRDSLQRLGTLQGTSATLWIGANSDLEAKNRLAAAGRAAQTLRLALRDGVVPGGGVALLHGQDAMSERLKSSGDEMEEAALRIVIDALRAPAEALLINCGYEPAPVIAGIRRRGAPTGYDVIAGCFGDMHAMGLVDPARVVATAARTAVRGAALALTIDVIVHTRTTEVSTSPE